MHESTLNLPHTRRRGFTFIELLISMSVLSVVAVGIAAAMVQGPKVSRGAREEMAARLAIAGTVSELSSTPYSTMAASYADTGFEVEGIQPTHGDKDGLPGKIEIKEVNEGGGIYYKITLTASWTGVTGERTLTSVHYISNARGDTAPSSTPTSTGGGGGSGGSTDPNTPDDPNATATQTEPPPAPAPSAPGNSGKAKKNKK